MITEIRIETTESGPLLPNQERVHDVRITRDGLIVHEVLSTKGENERGMRHIKDEYNVDPEKTASFLDSLSTEFTISEWKTDLGSPVLEGRTYEVTVRYDDRSVQRSRGTVGLPPGGEAIRQAVRQLAAFKKEPWIF
ncbi:MULTISPECIES: hypothetical protein [Bhargavaea]|uniref:Uncharacterized protein n=1 Tax=Bhargavaea changchunensis TaxID=2134037 RepID=A0ABW2NHM8_9BACL|nr:hypothetical protein [Bhargavaea sp. CC-171006]